jgi:hypothetical protein
MGTSLFSPKPPFTLLSWRARLKRRLLFGCHYFSITFVENPICRDITPIVDCGTLVSADVEFLAVFLLSAFASAQSFAVCIVYSTSPRTEDGDGWSQ